MNIKVSFLGHFEKLIGKREETIKINANITIEDLIELLKPKLKPEHQEFFDHALIVQNGQMAKPNAKLLDNDDIVFMSPVIGGG